MATDQPDSESSEAPELRQWRQELRQQKRDLRRPFLLPILGVLAALLALWVTVTVSAAVVAYHLTGERDWKELLGAAGTIGDAFGAANAIFSAMALLGVIVAILMQRSELELQRRELELTRRELKKSADAQERSQQSLKDQADSLFLTAYLNSLLAAVNGPNIEHASPEQWASLQKIERIASELDSRAAAFLSSESLDVLGRDAFVINRLKKMHRSLETAIHASDLSNDQSIVNEAIARLKEDFLRLSPAFEPEDEADAASIIGTIQAADKKYEQLMRASSVDARVRHSAEADFISEHGLLSGLLESLLLHLQKRARKARQQNQSK